MKPRSNVSLQLWSGTWERRLVLPYPAARVEETWVQVSAFDTSFDTNPKQRCERSGNTESSKSAYLGGFCNCQKRLETYRPRLKIMVSPVRVRVPPLPAFSGFFLFKPQMRNYSYAKFGFYSSLFWFFPGDVAVRAAVRGKG